MRDDTWHPRPSRKFLMNAETEKEYTIWQKMTQAQLMWIWEIVERLEVTVPLDLGAKDRRFLRISGRISGNNAPSAIDELDQLLHHQELVYFHTCVYHGDPLKRGHPQYRQSAGLCELEPHIVIAEAGLELIDVVMLGPEKRAAEIIASDPRLHAAARSRVMCCDADDSWCKVMSNTLARADSILARRAINAI